MSYQQEFKDKKKTFEDGDVVRLVSGGPLMSVYGQNYPYGPDFVPVACVWFDDMGFCRKEQFHPAALVKEARNQQPTGE